jgi:hypothetical protein
MPSKLSDHERATSTVNIADDQFAEIVRLLTPGYELAMAYKAQMAQAGAQPAADAPDTHDPDMIPPPAQNPPPAAAPNDNTGVAGPAVTGAKNPA